MSKGFKRALAAFVLIFALILSGCSNSSSNTKPANNDKDTTAKKDTETKKPVEIVWAQGKDVTGASKQIVEDFNNSHPNIHVTLREMPNDSGQQHDAYVTMLNAKSSEIDVFDVDVVWPAELAQASYVLPLDRFIQQDNIDLSQYNQGALSAAHFNGKQWAMPRFIDAGLLFYRKDIVSDPPKTWDDLIKLAKEDNGKNGTKYGYVFQAKQYEGLVCNAIEFISAYGGKVVDDNGQVVINSPETIKGLKKLVEIANSDFVPKNVTTFTEPESATQFIEGNSVFIRNWPYQWALANDKTQSKIVDKVGVAPLPAGDKGSAAALGGWMAAINANSNHKKEAWEFLKYLTGPEGEKTMAIKGGNAPTYNPLYKDQDVLKANPFFANESFVNGLNAAVSRPVVPNYQEVSEVIQIHVSKAIAGQETVEQAVQNMEKELKDKLK